jgi:hypothetical protein
MFRALPPELACGLLGRLGAADLRNVRGVCREARTEVMDAIHSIAHRRGWADAIDDFTPHGLLGMEMACHLRAVLERAPEQIDALSNCVEFQLYRPTLDQLQEDRGSVLWHDGTNVELGPASSFRDEVDCTHAPPPHGGWDEQVIVDGEVIDVAARGDRVGFLRLTDLRPTILHTRVEPRLQRVFTKLVHEPTEALHACMVHVRSAALLASLVRDLD